MDIWNNEKRSAVMSRIRSKETKPEIMVRKFLFSHGFRYRKNDENLPGKPDIVIPKYKTIIFVHGCFWHGHILDGKTRHRHLPVTNKDYWLSKIQKNEDRDKEINQRLEALGWRVIILWECELSSIKKREFTLNSLIKTIRLENNRQPFKG